MPQIHVTTFYHFTALSEAQVNDLKTKLEQIATRTQLHGLCLLGREGINTTLAGTEASIQEVKELVRSTFQAPNLHFKDSTAAKQPFQDFRIKVKNEIVTLGRPDLVPKTSNNNHLSPEEWHQALQDPETIVIDTRNDYEVEIGKFKTAIDFGIKEFRDFPSALQSAQIAKDKRVLIYCTGGIRCEKAILDMQEQGFEKVYQLEGGILNYLEKFPHQEFAGECFVFDYRVAVDQELKPSVRFKLCPHCGQPAEISLTCQQCQTPSHICHHCHDKGIATCSKNCAHHARIGSKSKRPHKQELALRYRQ